MNVVDVKEAFEIQTFPDVIYKLFNSRLTQNKNSQSTQNAKKLFFVHKTKFVIEIRFFFPLFDYSFVDYRTACQLFIDINGLAIFWRKMFQYITAAFIINNNSLSCCKERVESNC